MLVLSNEDVERLLPMPDCIAALEPMYADYANGLALIGSGWQAGAQLTAALAVRRFREVRVFSPRKESRDAFVAEARKRHPGVAIDAVDSAEACVANADVVAAATSSMVRVIDPAW